MAAEKFSKLAMAIVYSILIECSVVNDPIMGTLSVAANHN